MLLHRDEDLHHYKYHPRHLLKKMLSPLCGIVQEVGYVQKSKPDMRLMVGSAALTGVHQLFGYENPGRGAYHIGGTGFLPNESLIRILAESIERYAQLTSFFSLASQLVYSCYEKLSANEKVLSEKHFSLFSSDQYNQAHFPFSKWNSYQNLSWLKMQSYLEREFVFVPAQFVLVGYKIQTGKGEPWLSSAVTTGTATHCNYTLACKAALLEIVQLDTIMGHWYSGWTAYEITFDSRLKTLSAIMSRYSHAKSTAFKFYYIPNPDTQVFTIACLYLQEKSIPKVVIGLGADLHLEHAMYKALLETVASIGLGRMLVVKNQAKSITDSQWHAQPIYDLDKNVEYYARGNNFARIEERFLKMPNISAAELPEDIRLPEKQVYSLLKSFKETHKELYFLNLTGVEAEQLGFKVVRFWSPDMLALNLPSAPPILHSRFKSYGGLTHTEPHPYP